jgi:YVTN family beta-propeller protein
VLIIDDSGNNTTVPAGTISVGQDPFALAVSPNGKRLYVLDPHAKSVWAINTATNTVTFPIPLPGVGPVGYSVTVNPNGKFVYVGYDSGVFVIDTSTNIISATIPGVGTGDGWVSPDGSVLYVFGPGGNTVSAISTATNTVIKTINVGVGSSGLAVSSTRLYVSKDADDTVTVFTL